MVQQQQPFSNANGQQAKNYGKGNNFSVSGRGSAGGANASPLKTQHMAKTAQKLHSNDQDQSQVQVQQYRYDARSLSSALGGENSGAAGAHGDII